MRVRVLENFYAGAPGTEPAYHKGELLEGSRMETAFQYATLKELLGLGLVEVVPDEKEGDPDPGLIAGDENPEPKKEEKKEKKKK